MPTRAPSVVTRLKGGLGNQLFQYSFGRLLSEHLNRPLLVDARTGFIHDPHKRKYALNLIGLDPEIANYAQSGSSYLAQLLAQKRSTTDFLVDTPLGQVFLEKQTTPQKIPFDASSSRKLIISGLWQSLDYVDPIRPILVKEISPSLIKSKTMKAMGHTVDFENAAVVAIRTFSESAKNHERFLRNTTSKARQIQSVLDGLAERDGIRTLVIVSTEKNALGNALRWPYGQRIEAYASDPRFDERFVFDLFQKSKIHIMLTSTLYWWATYLSGTNPMTVRRWIFDDFANPSLIPNHWSRITSDYE